MVVAARSRQRVRGEGRIISYEQWDRRGVRYGFRSRGVKRGGRELPQEEKHAKKERGLGLAKTTSHRGKEMACLNRTYTGLELLK